MKISGNSQIKEILEIIKAGDLSKVPSAASLPDSLQQSLWALWAVKEVSPDTELAPAQISIILREICGVDIHWRTVQTLLSSQRGLVFKRTRSGTPFFKIMKPGEDMLFGSEDFIYFVNPETAYSATTRLHDLLAQTSGVVRICDPYADRTALDHLTAIPTACQILWLTSKIKGGDFRQELAAFSRQFAPIEVRILSKELHDRYVIDDNSMFILGTSLNSFGKSQSFVIAAGHQIREAIVKVFDSNWGNAQLLS